MPVVTGSATAVGAPSRATPPPSMGRLQSWRRKPRRRIGSDIGASGRKLHQIPRNADEKQVDRTVDVELSILDHAIEGRFTPLAKMTVGRSSLRNDAGHRIGGR